MKDKLIVSPAPNITKDYTTNSLMYLMVVALLPTAISGIINFGMNALYLILLSIGCCYVFDMVFSYLKTRNVNFFDFSSVVTGLVIALTLPVSAPLYFVVIGSFIAIVIIKGCFGGIGKNIFNPAGVARVVLGFIFSGLSLEMFKGIALDGVVASPLSYFSIGDYSTITLRSMFFGSAPGAIGTVSIICILITGVVLMCLSVTDFIIPLGAFVAFMITTWVGSDAIAIVPYLLSGSFAFVTLFMLPEPTSSPNTVWGKLFYGLIFGLLAGLFRVYSVLGETGVFVALLIVNMLSHLLDKIFMPRPLGFKKGDAVYVQK